MKPPCISAFAALFAPPFSHLFQIIEHGNAFDSIPDRCYPRNLKNWIFTSATEPFQLKPIPEGSHWSDVRVVTSNVGQALQKAMRCIEKANPETFYGIFGDAVWSDKERLPDSLLRDLIEHFSRIGPSD
jgi:type I restriction-modification system DNA methylase subunit